MSQWPRQVLLTLVRGYRLFFSAWIGNVCRYHPSCSQYALDALNRHGALGGSAWAAWRVLRCNPWSLGGCDPVPGHRPFEGLFTRLPLVAGNLASNAASTVAGDTARDDFPESKKLP